MASKISLFGHPVSSHFSGHPGWRPKSHYLAIQGLVIFLDTLDGDFDRLCRPRRVRQDLGGHLIAFECIFVLNVFGNFFEISLKFQSWHARAGTAQFGLDSWLAFSRSALGTRLRAILFSFRCTCRRPGDTRRALAEAASRF